MSTFHDLQVGETFVSPPRTLTEHDVKALIGIGGYTHPLFTDPSFLASTPFDRTPLPGEGVLHLMGGLVEQTGRFDDTTIALVGLDDVRFISPVFAETTISVEVEVVEKKIVSDGARGVLTMRWRALDQDDAVMVEATAAMLFKA